MIQKKPGYVAEALNVDAIVRESTPYLVAIYTAGLGGTTQKVLKSVALVFINWDNWLMLSMNGIVSI